MPLPPLPAPGQVPDVSKDVDIITHLQRLAEESRFDRGPWENIADLNLLIYTYGSDPPPGTNDVVINEIQTHIIAGQLQEPPQPSLVPVETGEPAQIYWAGDPNEGLALGLTPQEAGAIIDPATGQPVPSIPIRQQVGLTLVDMVENGQIRDEWVIELNDRLMAETFQTLFDLFAKRSQTNRFVSDNMLDTDVVGWAWGLYEFDDDFKRHCHRHLPVKQVYIDPTCRDIADASYAGMDMTFDVDEAKKLYPDLADVIEANKQEMGGLPNRPDGMTQWGQAYDRDFKRGIVVLRAFWIRNQEQPLTVEAALALGKIEQRSVQDESGAATNQIGQDAQGPDAVVSTGDVGQGNAEGAESNNEQTGSALVEPGDGSTGGGGTDGRSDNADGGGRAEDVRSQAQENQAVGDEDGPDQTQAKLDGPIQSGDDQGTSDESGTGEAGDVGADRSGIGSNEGQIPQAVSQPTRPSYFLTGTDLEVFPPDHPDAIPADAPPWPFRLVIREIITIAGKVVADRECQHWDIPIVHNVNIPIPFKPYGLGEPFRLYPIQRARTRMVGSIVQHCEFFKAPLVNIPASVQAQLPDNQKTGMVKPGTRFVWKDDLFIRMNGNMMSVQNPPNLPEALIDGQNVLKTEMQEQSGHTPALAGIKQSGVESGYHEGLLQQAATAVIDFKHRRGGEMCKRLGLLQLHSLIHRLSCDDIYKVITQFPYHILEAICERAKNSDWDLEIEQTSGNASAKAMRKAEAKDDYLNGLIDFQTYCERAGENYYQIRRRQRTEAKRNAGMQAQQQQGQAQTQQTQPKKPGSNGQNGKQQGQQTNGAHGTMRGN